jgi:CubicO group peptidase (beta-lactamase class C family)
MSWLYCIPVVLLFLGATAGARAAAGEPVFPDADWRECGPEAQGLDPARLTAAVEFLAANSGRDRNRELVIVRRGWLVLRGDNIDHVHGIWSCTKSITSTMLGLLVADGKCTPGTRAAEILPELQARYGSVTLRDFASMMSGYRAAGDDEAGGHGQSKTPFEPGEPMFEPGGRYLYWDSAMNKFAEALTILAGEPLQDLFKRRIADPIGMNPAQWRWGTRGERHGLSINGGAGNGGGHLFTSARELARFGLLFLNHGRWKGRELVDVRWVREATRPHAGAYGFNWWTNHIQPDGTRKWPGAPPVTFAALGYNNNHLFIIPEWEVVVVRLGLDHRDTKMTDATWSEFFARFAAAVSPAAAGKSSEAHGAAIVLPAEPDGR